MRSGFILLFLLLSQLVHSQVDSTRMSRFFAYPLGFYAPETKLGLGAAGTYVFRLRGISDTIMPSQISFGAAYTSNGQLLLYAPFRIYAAKGRLVSYGEAGYYRFTYNFYGVGNAVPWTYSESYLSYFSRFRLNLLWQVKPHEFFGPRLWFEQQDIRKTALGGLLDSQVITGASGSRSLGLGATMNLDFRDNLFYPRKGWFAELAIQTFNRSFGSSSNWTRYLADVSIYKSLGKKQVLAINALLDWNDGNPPFTLMASLGGGRRMRGYYEGRFRDLKSLLIQAEYRVAIQGRFSGTIFGSLGGVSSTVNGFGQIPYRSSGGFGIRFRVDRKEQLNLRLDLALGRNSRALYFTVGEAF